MSVRVSTDSAPLVFEAGARRWLVSAASVREVHETLDVQPVPGTSAWFLGTALPRGRVVAVSDFGAWLGQPGQVHRYLEFEQGFALGVTGVLAVDGPVPEDVDILDPERLLATRVFLDVTGPGGSAFVVIAT